MIKTIQENVEIVDDLDKIITEKSEITDDAYYVANLSDVAKKFETWKRLLPNVEPFYAVKCNDDPVVLSTLANLGTSFDCASKLEIKKILKMGVKPNRIIYANPCKQSSHIKAATKHGVSLMTFDNVEELYKIKSICPTASLVLRILPPDDSKSQCQLGMKYGAHPNNWKNLLQTAKNLELNVTGVSFHVGSGCFDPTAFSAAVRSAFSTFELAKSLGYNLTLLDIGGGFPGHCSAQITFEDIVNELKPALNNYFPAESGIRIIAEPGRYFVASAFTLAVNVIAKRVLSNEEDQQNGEKSIMYYVNDGVYGSFNCLLYDHAHMIPLDCSLYKTEDTIKSSVWGPTCDGLDCINEAVWMSELSVGDWIIYNDMGAYTMCAASMFNGMKKPVINYVILNEYRDIFDLTPENEIESPHLVSVQA